MGNIYLLDCTLRDGGYINDWRFGEETIKGFCRKIAQTGIEIVEVVLSREMFMIRTSLCFRTLNRFPMCFSRSQIK